MKITLVLCLFALALLFATPARPQTSSTAELPYSPSLDLTSMDKSIDPCVNLYQYSCGRWQQQNPIPPDQTSWSVYAKLYADNLNFLRGILEQAAANTGQRDAVSQKIGDFYAACIDESAIETRGIDAIKPQLDAIARMKSVHDMASMVAQLQLNFSRSMLFGGGSDQDPDNSEQIIASLDQGGLGLPDRDYYTKDDAKSRETRERYVQHVQKIFELLGDNPETAKNNAQTLMRMETALAKASLTQVERRDPYKLKNKMDLPALEKLTPNFDWQTYYTQLQYPKIAILNVTAPAFFQTGQCPTRIRTAGKLENLSAVPRSRPSSPYLSANFVQENFDFYRKYLRGAKEMQPRWKRCVQYTDRDLGEALGQAYVRKVFSPELKQSTLEMVQQIEAAMEQRIRQPRLDEPGNQAASPRQAPRHSQQDRLSRQMARLQFRNHHAQRFHR